MFRDVQSRLAPKRQIWKTVQFPDKDYVYSKGGKLNIWKMCAALRCNLFSFASFFSDPNLALITINTKQQVTEVFKEFQNLRENIVLFLANAGIATPI